MIFHLVRFWSLVAAILQAKNMAENITLAYLTKRLHALGQATVRAPSAGYINYQADEQMTAFQISTFKQMVERWRKGDSLREDQ